MKVWKFGDPEPNDSRTWNQADASEPEYAAAEFVEIYCRRMAKYEDACAEGISVHVKDEFGNVTDWTVHGEATIEYSATPRKRTAP